MSFGVCFLNFLNERGPEPPDFFNDVFQFGYFLIVSFIYKVIFCCCIHVDWTACVIEVNLIYLCSLCFINSAYNSDVFFMYSVAGLHCSLQSIALYR